MRELQVYDHLIDSDTEDDTASTDTKHYVSLVRPLLHFPIYTIADFALNCLNKNRRFKDNSGSVAYVLLAATAYYTPSVTQYVSPIPAPMLEDFDSSDYKPNTTVPQIEMLADIYAHGLPNGGLSVRGKTALHKFPMRSRRAYRINISKTSYADSHYTFHPCSPTKPNETFEFDMPVARFLETEEAQRIVVEKGMKHESAELTLSKEDIPKRESMNRKPDQNTVKGESAVIAAKKLHDQYHSILDPDFIKLLTIGFSAKLLTQIKPLKTRYTTLKSRETELKKMPVSEETYKEIQSIDQEKQELRQQMRKIIQEAYLRFEWLHGNSYTNTPLNENPQISENLGAAMAWLNTKMMILELTARWFMLNVPGALVKTQYAWEKLLDTEILNHISFLVTIRIGEFTIYLPLEIDTFLENPEHVKTSDLAGLIYILCMLIQNITPFSTQRIHILPEPPRAASHRNLTFFQIRERDELSATPSESDCEPIRKKQRIEDTLP